MAHMASFTTETTKFRWSLFVRASLSGTSHELHQHLLAERAQTLVPQILFLSQTLPPGKNYADTCLVASTHLKNSIQNGNLPQTGVPPRHHVNSFRSSRNNAWIFQGKISHGKLQPKIAGNSDRSSDLRHRKSAAAITNSIAADFQATKEKT